MPTTRPTDFELIPMSYCTLPLWRQGLSSRRKKPRIGEQNAITENSSPQAAMTFEKILCSWCDRPIHPVTRAAFARPLKAHPLDLEFTADQRVQVHPPCDHIPAERRWRAVGNAQSAAERLEDFESEKGDLAFVILLVIKEAIAANAMTGDTFDARDFDCQMPIRLTPMMAEEIMAGRDIELTNLNRHTFDPWPLASHCAKSHRQLRLCPEMA